MKRVLFDLMVCQPVEESMYHGGGEYTKTVFKELCEKYLDYIELTVFYNPDLFIDQWIVDYIDLYHIGCFYVHSYEDSSITCELIRADAFVACLLSGVDKIAFPPKVKVVGVYHGFRSLEKPIDCYSYYYEKKVTNKIKEITKYVFRNLYYKHKWKELNQKIRCCSDIIAVSEHSGYSAQVFFPDYPKDHIHVLYSPMRECVANIKMEEINTKHTILMLGGDRWIKNLFRGVIAIDELFSEGHLCDYSVVVIGGIPKGVWKKIHNKRRFNPLGYLSLEELEQEYQKCELLFYPTLNEGFGYPPEEALRHAKTCIVSAVSSLTEIYKDAVYYCNPYDIKEMKTRIIQATEVKIKEEVIERVLKELEDRQREDLGKLCKLIIE